MTSASRGHYLQAPQIAIIFLAFLLLTLPLASLQLASGVPAATRQALTLAYVVLVGNTHFAITWALYLNRENLEHFGSSTGRRLIYFGGPVLILALFWYLGVQQVPRPGTAIFVPVAILLTAADYFHVVRQSFGVFQLFRARTGARFAPWSTNVNNAYFLALWALQLTTFARGLLAGGQPGHLDLADPLTRAGLAAALVCLGLMLRELAGAWRQGADRPALLAALGYLGFQSASALMVVYDSRLYVASLAMHYVEYHVLMAPRLFGVALDPASRADRVAAFFRRHRAVFYLTLVLVGAWAASAALLGLAGRPVSPSGPQAWWYLVNLFNGIFLAHYFIEAFVWKFGHPYYRRTLAPLYFNAIR